MLLEEYGNEQSHLEESVASLQSELTTYAEDSNRVDKFVESVHKYTDFTELTAPMKELTPEEFKEEEKKRKKRAWNCNYMPP